MNNLPIKYQAARRALAAACRVDEVKSIRDKAVAMEVYAKQARDGELIGFATEMRKRAERRLGELMEADRKAGKLAKGGGEKGVGRRGKNAGRQETRIPTLAAQNVDKNLADRARKAAALPEDKFERAVATAVRTAIAAVEGDKAIVRHAREAQQKEKRERRDVRERVLGGIQLALPNKKYGVILADPEWRFEPWSRATGMDRAADNHYPTSCTEVIAARDVPSIAADDSVLFLCATAPMLPHALLVMAVWGFDYKSNYVLQKDRPITGYWNRNKHEHLLIGTRGNIPCPAAGTQWESLIPSPVNRHSAKSPAILDMIEQYFPTLPKIELNRRGPARPGWDAWGNEAGMFGLGAAA